MKRNFADRVAAAEKALEAHLDARERHITRHQAWRKRLVDAQDFVSDEEEARTQASLIALMDERIRALQTDAQRANREQARLEQDKADALRDPGGHTTLLRIVGKWENVAPARKDKSRDQLTESTRRLGLVNIERTRTGPSRGFFFKWGVKGAALVAILALFTSFDVEEGDGPFYKRVSVAEGGGFAQITGGDGGSWSVSALETMITETTGLPPLTEIVPSALKAVKLN